MPELHDLLEKRASHYEPPSDLFDRVLDRRRRRDRNGRIGAAVVALAVVAATFAGLARALTPDRGAVPADQPSSRFVGTWASINYNDYIGGDTFDQETMSIRAGEDGVLHITVHDDSSYVCSDTPTTMTGTGRLEDPTTLVVPSPVLACVDGSDIRDVGVAHPQLLGELDNYTLVLDLATDRLFDNLGVAWHRGAAPENGANTTTECEGEPQVDSPGTCSMLGGEVTFHADRPWTDHVESYLDPRIFWLIGQPDEAGIEILANPLPEASCDPLPGVPASAEAVVRAIRSNPDLEATEPVAERVGGIDALRLDVAAVPGASTCPLEFEGTRIPVVSVSNRGAWGVIDHGDLARLYVLDLPGGSARALVIKITAPEARFERVVEAAEPVVDSFEFHTG